MTLKVIAFDADDTLFVNEPYFQETEQKFCGLMSDYLSHQGLSQALAREHGRRRHDFRVAGGTIPGLRRPQDRRSRPRQDSPAHREKGGQRDHHRQGAHRLRALSGEAG